MVRVTACPLALFVIAVLHAGTAAANADGDRDFVFTDEEGHLVLRFAGSPSGALTEDQTDEVVNMQLSTMVHDRIRADSVFEMEARDAGWADRAETLLERRIEGDTAEFSAVAAECRSARCRVILEHPVTWTVAAHQALMSRAQAAVQALIAAEPGSFEPEFMIAAHYQEPDRPYMKLFLQRAQPDGR